MLLYSTIINYIVKTTTENYMQTQNEYNNNYNKSNYFYYLSRYPMLIH